MAFVCIQFSACTHGMRPVVWRWDHLRNIRFHVLPLSGILAFGLGAWFLILGIYWGSGPPAVPAEASLADPPPIAVGRAAPDFTVATVDGTLVSLGALRGQPVVLLFWAGWCPPCSPALAHLENLKHRVAPKTLHILAVNIMEPADTVAKVAAAHGGSMTFLLDSDAGVSNLYGVRAAPTYFFIDREGIVIGRVSGAGRERLVEGLLARLLDDSRNSNAGEDGNDS